MIFFLFSIFTFSIFVYQCWIRKQRKGYELPPRQPSSWPVIGIAHLFFRMKDTRGLMKLIIEMGNSCQDAGGVAHGYLGPLLLYSVTEPEDCITILHTCLEKKLVYNLAKRWCGDGLAVITDNMNLWKHHRKIINRAFNQQVLDNYMTTFNKQAERFVNNLSEHVNTGPFEHMPAIEHLSLGIMHQTTMGLDEIDLSEDVCNKHKNAMRTMFNTIALRFQTYWMHSDFLYNFSSLKKKEDENLALLKNISEAVLQKKREVLTNTDRKPKKFKPYLDLLMELPPEEAFTDQELKEEVDTMMVAGSDTTATMITYALMLLGSHQDVQNEVYKELTFVFGDSYRAVEKQDVPKLELLDAVIMETLRLYPILPVMPRYVAEDVKIKNYTLPAGSTCLVFVYHMHRNPGLWGPDAEQFRPQRWIEGVPSNASRTFAGFSSGKRNCIGKTYAMTSMKTTLAHMLRHYRVVADITKLELQLDLLIKPASGCEIALYPRKQQ